MFDPLWPWLLHLPLWALWLVWMAWLLRVTWQDLLTVMRLFRVHPDP